MRGGHERHGGGRGDLVGCIFPVQWQQTMEGGTGVRLLLVPLFTRGWRADEQEMGQNGAQELNRAT